MRRLIPAVGTLVFLFLMAIQSGCYVRADSLKDEGFKAPSGEFSLPPGTFKPSGDFKPTPGDFKPAPGAFRPSQDFKPDSGAFTVKPGTFTPPMGDFRPSADFTVHPGTFYIGNGFLKPENVKEEKPKPEKDNKK